MKFLFCTVAAFLSLINSYGKGESLFNPRNFLILPIEDTSHTKMAIEFLQEEILRDFNISAPILNSQTGLPHSATMRGVIGAYLKKSMDNLDASPEEFLRCRTNAGVAEKIAKDKIGLAFSIQGLGFIYEEKLGQIDTAVHLINIALRMWNEMNDTMQRANLYKYRGYLWGLNKKFDVGFRDMDTALILYRAKQYEPGIAVSQSNLGNIYFEIGNNDSALHYYKEALIFWKRMMCMDGYFKLIQKSSPFWAIARGQSHL